MKVQDLENLSIEEIKTMPESQLRRLVSRTATTLNKRITNIRYNPKTSKISVDAVKNSGGKFKTTYLSRNKKGKLVRKPMNKKQLITEAKREKNFMKGVASTVKKAKEFKEKQQKEAGGQTMSDYGHAEARKARQKRAAEIKEENRAKGIKKMTKEQKSELSSIYKARYKEASKQYDDAVDRAWTSYHNWKEINQLESRATDEESETIQETVQKSVFMGEDERKAYFSKSFSKYLKEQELEYEAQQDAMPDLGNPMNLLDQMQKKKEESDNDDLLNIGRRIELH